MIDQKLSAAAVGLMPTVENMFVRIYADNKLATKAHPKTASLRRMLRQPARP